LRTHAITCVHDEALYKSTLTLHYLIFPDTDIANFYKKHQNEPNIQLCSLNY